MKIKTSYLFQDNEGAAFLRGAKDGADALRMAREIWPNATADQIRRWNGTTYVKLDEVQP